MGVSGYYRIRSKTQGVAISLGDVIKMKQKNLWRVCCTNRTDNVRNVTRICRDQIPIVWRKLPLEELQSLDVVLSEIGDHF